MDNLNKPTHYHENLHEKNYEEEIQDHHITISKHPLNPVTEAVSRATGMLSIPNESYESKFHFDEETITFNHTRELAFWIRAWSMWKRFPNHPHAKKPHPITIKINSPQKLISVKKPTYKFTVRVTTSTAVHPPEMDPPAWLNWIRDEDKCKFTEIRATNLIQVKKKAMDIAKKVDEKGIKKALQYAAHQWNPNNHNLYRLIGYVTPYLNVKFQITVESLKIEMSDFLYQEHIFGRH